jgi:transcription-repair coupling factor (superfamily II helicase)
VYRRLARVRDAARLDDFRREPRDRCGPVPEPAEWLLRTAELRLLAARGGERLRVVDEKSAYYRLQTGDGQSQSLYEGVKQLLRI